MVKGWSAEERQKLRDEVPVRGFRAEIRDRNVLTLAQETLRLAARACSAASGSIATAATRRAICVRWKNRLPAASRRRRNCSKSISSEWNGSVDPIYAEYAY